LIESTLVSDFGHWSGCEDLPGNVAEDEDGDDVDDDPSQVHLAVSTATQVVTSKSANMET